ncbi:MAG: MerC domain-containing protein [candidate division NC10 bacterium]|nr:MerC domain-containing protein [candidate division NC10 bacterium]
MPRLHGLGVILDKLGLSGVMAATVTSLGCCAPAIVAPYAAFLSSIGLGFLVDFSVAVPILYGAVGIILLGLTISFRRHRCPYPLLLAVLGGAALLYPYHTVLEVPVFIVLVFGGQALLITASILDLFLARRWRTRQLAHEPLCHLLPSHHPGREEGTDEVV